MRRFVWRLQKVLDIKAKEEQVKQMELFRLTETLAEKQSELLVRQHTLRELLGKLSKDRSPERLGAQEFFLKHVTTNDRLIKASKKEIRDLEVCRKEKIAEVLAAKQFRQGLEKLRDEAKEQFIREQEKLEQKEMDDRTSATFAHAEARPSLT